MGRNENNLSPFRRWRKCMGEMMTDDMELVQEYARNSSEAAFATLVARYVNLVYSTAFRQVGDPHLAEEITQAVFIILAQKAGSLSLKTILSGWLYRTARYASANALTIQRRRQHREQEAYMQSILNEPASETWTQIAPLLDAAMGQLGEKDHDAIVLRFFDGRNLKDVGLALGASEDAAKKRVGRALEKLHRYFSKRGVSSTTAIIAGAISANSVQAAPVALAKSMTAMAIAKGAAASGSTLTLIKGALKIMAWTKAKTTIVIGAAVVLAAGTTTPIIVHHYRANASIFSSTKELSDSDNAKFVALTGTTPAQAARTFLEASSSGDWAEVAKYWDPEFLKKHPEDLETHKNFYGGMELISLGKPFRGRVIEWNNAEYAGIYVPYEIRLKNGSIKKWQLCIRCDNPEHRWYFDGGM